MSEQSQGPGWWLASDGRWYPPAAAEPAATAVRPVDPTARSTMLPTGAPPPEPVWDGNAWTTTDASGGSFRWDGTQWQPLVAPVAAPSPAAPAPVSVVPVAKRNGGKGLLLVVGAVMVVVLLGAGFAVLRRGSGGDGFNTGVPVAGPDEDPSGKVTLNPNTVVVRGGASTVKAVSTDHTTYTLDAGAPGVAELAEGKVALIAGIDAGKVTSITREGATAKVTIEPAAITDVVQDGEFSWDDARPEDGKALAFVGAPIPSDPETTAGSEPDSTSTTASVQPSALRAGEGDEVLPFAFSPHDPDADLPPEVQRRHPTPPALEPGESAADPSTAAPPQPERSLTMRVSGWEVGFNATKAGAGLDIEMTAKKGVKGGEPAPPSRDNRPPSGFDSDTGALELGVTVKMHLDEAKHSSKFSVSGGSITNLSAKAPMTGWAEGSASAKSEQAGQYPKSLVIKVPIAYEWPVFIYGIPFYVYVQTNFLLQPSISTRTTGLDAPVRVEFNGDAGVQFDNGKASNAGTTVTGTVKDKPLDKVNATPTIGAMAMVFAIQAPRIGFGIGTTAYAAGARAGVFFDFVTSLGITIGPSTAIVACRSLSLTLTAGVGGEIKIKFWGPDSEATVGTKSTLWKEQKDWYEPKVPACKV